MSRKTSISFLHSFDLGNRHVDVPDKNILFVTSQAEGDFKVENILTESIRHTWRSANSLVKQEIIIKAEMKSNLDCFAILGHNFTESAYVTVQANVANNFVAPPVTKIVPYSKGNMIISTDFGGQYEYYKVSILDIANPCGYVEIGRIVAGRLLKLVDNEDITDSYKVGHKDMSESMKTQGFFRASNINITQRTLDASFSKLRTDIGHDTNYKNLRDFFESVKTVKPFLVILDYENPQKLNIWGQFTDIPDENFGLNDYVSMSLKIEEVF